MHTQSPFPQPITLGQKKPFRQNPLLFCFCCTQDGLPLQSINSTSLDRTAKFFDSLEKKKQKPNNTALSGTISVALCTEIQRDAAGEHCLIGL